MLVLWLFFSRENRWKSLSFSLTCDTDTCNVEQRLVILGEISLEITCECDMHTQRRGVCAMRAKGSGGLLALWRDVDSGSGSGDR